MREIIITVLALMLLTPLYAPVASAQDLSSPSYWEDKEIVVETELNLNVVFLGSLSVSRQDLETELKEIMPWYAPYIAYDKKYAGLNFSKINLNIYQAPPAMQRDFTNFIEEIDRDFFNLGEGQEIAGRYEQELFSMLGGSLPTYWADAWLVQEWLYENGPKYIQGLKENDYTIYFITSAELLNALVIYYVDTYSPETKRYFLEGGMTAFGGVHRLYFIDLTSVPMGSDRCGGEPGCKSPTFEYYPSLLINKMPQPVLIKHLATIISEVIIYIFFRGYLYEPSYEVNFYYYFLIIDATSTNAARVLLQDFSEDYVSKAVRSLYPYSYFIIETRLEDIDDYPALKQAVFERSPRLGRTIILNCDIVPEIVFNLPVIKRFETVKTVITVLFILDDDAYVCDDGVLGVGFKEGAIAAASYFLTRVEGPSITLYHESAHVLGLRHPHDANPIPWKRDQLNWFYDWSATPMTYQSACALRSMYEGEYFVTIDKDSIDLGVTLKMVKDARRAVYYALTALEEADIPTPASLTSLLQAVDEDIRNAAREIAAYNYFDWVAFYGIGVQKASAFDYGYSALQNALTLSKSVETLFTELVGKARAEAELKNLQTQYEKLRESNAQLESQVKSLQAALDEARRENAALSNQIQGLRNEVNGLRNTVNLLQAEKQNLEKENAALAERLRNVESEANNLRTLVMVLGVVLAVAVVGTVFLTRLFKGRRALPPPPHT